MLTNKFFFNLLTTYIFAFIFFFNTKNSSAIESGKDMGKELFIKNCSICHMGGNNIIIPEKNLKKDALEENGMNTINAISYQILNGKNGMPAFGGRLQENEIEAISKYVLEESNTNFSNGTK
jgi:cytochrome c6